MKRKRKLAGDEGSCFHRLDPGSDSKERETIEPLRRDHRLPVKLHEVHVGVGGDDAAACVCEV